MVLGIQKKIWTNLISQSINLCIKSSHVGIDNLKYRFKLIFENEADIYFYNAPYSGAVVEMTIPAKEDDSDENINN